MENGCPSAHPHLSSVYPHLYICFCILREATILKRRIQDFHGDYTSSAGVGFVGECKNKTKKAFKIKLSQFIEEKCCQVSKPSHIHRVSMCGHSYSVHFVTGLLQ